MATKKKKKTQTKTIDSLFTVEGIRDFIRFVEKSGVAEVEVSHKDNSIFVSRHSRAGAAAPAPAIPAAPAAPAAQAPVPAAAEKEPPKKDSNLVEITSPIVGTFYRSSSPGADPFLNVGDTVSPGKVVCIIEAMKIFNEIKSEVSGVVREVCLDNEQPVEFGQVLFLVEPK